MKRIKVKCLAVDRYISEFYTPGKWYTLEVLEKLDIAQQTREVPTDREGCSLRVSRERGDNHRYRVTGYEGTLFDAKPWRFRKKNHFCVDIDYSKCARSIRRQARNVAKELYSCGKLEKIARSYGK